MSDYTEALEGLVETIQDYRLGEIPPRTPGLIEAWLGQFPAGVRQPLLIALSNVLKRSYISREDAKQILAERVSLDLFAPVHTAADYWRTLNFLLIQQHGSSQRELLGLLDEVLRETHGFGVADAGSPHPRFVYVDDCIFTGHTLRSDICTWLDGHVPYKATLHIMVLLSHRGAFWVDREIRRASAKKKRMLSFDKWVLSGPELENRKKMCDRSDVLWPTAIPQGRLVRDYIQKRLPADYEPTLRKPGNSGASGIFESDEQKRLLEQVLLLQGCHICQRHPDLSEFLRPLGFSYLPSLGFGSVIVTYRNCPNNAPLAFWVDHDGHPALFPRKTNTATREEDHLIRSLHGT